jgi:uncharacterized protein (TIGR02266 family)
MQWLTAAREHVSGALIALQEAALSQDDPNLLSVAEAVAEVSGQLFRLHRAPPSEGEARAQVIRAREQLQAAKQNLHTLEHPAEIFRLPTHEVSHALASLEKAMSMMTASATSNERPVEARQPAPAHRKGLVLVAEDEGTEDVPETHPAEQEVERRCAQRVQLEVELGVHSESHFYTGLTLDLSTGGLFVATYELLPIGTLVSLGFVLPDGHSIHADGEVVWLRDSRRGELKPGMGISFAALGPEDVTAIREFCEARAPLYYDVD